MKKVYLLLIMVMFIAMCAACSESAIQSIGNEINDSFNNIADSDNQYVKMVKNGYNGNYPDLTYDKAFTAFFGTPRWHYFESDEGDDVVEFTGDCMYRNVSVKARLQFIVDEENGTFEAHYLAFNEVPQDLFTMTSLFVTVFEGIESDNDEEYAAETEESINQEELSWAEQIGLKHFALITADSNAWNIKNPNDDAPVYYFYDISEGMLYQRKIDEETYYGSWMDNFNEYRANISDAQFQILTSAPPPTKLYFDGEDGNLYMEYLETGEIELIEERYQGDYYEYDDYETAWAEKLELGIWDFKRIYKHDGYGISSSWVCKYPVGNTYAYIRQYNEDIWYYDAKTTDEMWDSWADGDYLSRIIISEFLEDSNNAFYYFFMGENAIFDFDYENPDMTDIIILPFDEAEWAEALAGYSYQGVESAGNDSVSNNIPADNTIYSSDGHAVSKGVTVYYSGTDRLVGTVLSANSANEIKVEWHTIIYSSKKYSLSASTQGGAKYRFTDSNGTEHSVHDMASYFAQYLYVDAPFWYTSAR